MAFKLDLKGTGMASINFSFLLISLDFNSIQWTLRGNLKINEKWKKLCMV